MAASTKMSNRTMKLAKLLIAEKGHQSNNAQCKTIVIALLLMLSGRLLIWETYQFYFFVTFSFERPFVGSCVVRNEQPAVHT